MIVIDDQADDRAEYDASLGQVFLSRIRSPAQQLGVDYIDQLLPRLIEERYGPVLVKVRTVSAKETGLELVTAQGGGRYATSVGGTLTGRGADLIIIDDPLNANEAQSETARNRAIDWYGGSLVSRLNDKEKGAIIAVMQRLHEDCPSSDELRHMGA